MNIVDSVSAALPGNGPVVKLMRIPCGSFQMGDVGGISPEADTRPVHKVNLDTFYMGRYAVTNEQFSWFVTQTGYRTTREELAPEKISWREFAVSGRERYPVLGMNWVDAASFAVWADLRLPTEGEWEKASRGGLLDMDYPWGNSPPYDQLNWRHSPHKPGLVPIHEQGWGLTPVGSYPPNGYGLYDMSGNVWEWCADAYHACYYEASSRKNPLGPEVDEHGISSPLVRWRNQDHLLVSSRSFRVLRGGAWDNEAFGLRSCERIMASARTHNRGEVASFRVAASVSSTS